MRKRLREGVREYLRLPCSSHHITTLLECIEQTEGGAVGHPHTARHFHDAEFFFRAVKTLQDLQSLGSSLHKVPRLDVAFQNTSI